MSVIPLSPNKLCILPDGSRLDLGNIVQYSLSGDTVSLVTVGGTTITVSGQTGMGSFLMEQFDAVMSGTSTNTTILASNIVIISITPNPMSIANPGSGTLTILGSGFNPATVGFLHFEDTTGGLDGNGYAWICTYVSPTQLTAVFSTSGDGTISVSDKVALVYYQDSNGVQSNVLRGTNPSGTTVSIP